MNIWVDIANSPQVLFLRPIIAELVKRGHRLIVTTRDHSETLPLADHYGLSHKVIGAHGGGTLIGKGIAILLRAISAAWYLRGRDISLAVSSSSYSQALATKWMNIPLVTFNDYEGNPGLHIICRVAKKILVPDIFCKQNLYPYGALEKKIECYNGLKENVYLNGFVPDCSFLEKAGIPLDKILVTLRPASEVSAYHQFENPLCEEVLCKINRHNEILVIVLPRNSQQRCKYEALGLSNVIFPYGVLDGPNLIYHSDLVIGAGGTMNREAVVLATPVYSLFLGRMGSIDQHLIDTGKMIWINTSSDINRIKLLKKNKSDFMPEHRDQNLLTEIVDKILE